MKKLLAAILAIGSLSAQASMLEVNGPLDQKFFDAEVTQNKTHFETLGDLFENGTLPDVTKMVNIAFSGRCFQPPKPNEPSNRGSIFRQKKSDVGPIGLNDSPVYEGISYSSFFQAPNYYDQFSFEELNKPKTKFLEININTTYLEIKKEDRLSRYRFSGKYLVEILVDTSEDAGTSGRENVYCRCYYFIPEVKL